MPLIRPEVAGAHACGEQGADNLHAPPGCQAAKLAPNALKLQENDLDDLPPIARQLATRSGDHEAILKQGGTNTWKQAIRAYLAAMRAIAGAMTSIALKV
mgnify:CR=1 FL=1